MTSKKTKSITVAETSALAGDVMAMEFLARRFFEGRGVQQDFQQSFYWSSIALEGGVEYLYSLNKFALKKLNQDEKDNVEAQLQGWFDSTNNPIIDAA